MGAEFGIVGVWSIRRTRRRLMIWRGIYRNGFRLSEMVLSLGLDY